APSRDSAHVLTRCNEAAADQTASTLIRLRELHRKRLDGRHHSRPCDRIHQSRSPELPLRSGAIPLIVSRCLASVPFQLNRASAAPTGGAAAAGPRPYADLQFTAPETSRRPRDRATGAASSKRHPK